MVTRQQLAHLDREKRQAESASKKAQRKLDAVLQKTQAAAREVERVARRRRTGLQVDEAGWFQWDEGTVRQMLVLVGERLAQVPDPVAVLEALLCETWEPVAASTERNTGMA